MKKLNVLSSAIVAAALSAGAVAGGHSTVDKTGWPDSFTVGTASQGGTTLHTAQAGRT